LYSSQRVPESLRIVDEPGSSQHDALEPRSRTPPRPPSLKVDPAWTRASCIHWCHIGHHLLSVTNLAESLSEQRLHDVSSGKTEVVANGVPEQPHCDTRQDQGLPTVDVGQCDHRRRSGLCGGRRNGEDSDVETQQSSAFLEVNDRDRVRGDFATRRDRGR